MISTVRKGSVALWAWVLSVVFHAILLALFAFLRFSGTHVASSPSVVPKVSVSHIKKLTDRTFVSTKPKFKDKSSSFNSHFKRVEPVLFDNTSPDLSQAAEKAPLELSNLASTFSHARNTRYSTDMLFGHTVNQRKICFVVDCSGSMHGMLKLLQEKLKTSINSLQPDQFFYVIFFLEGDKVLESGDGRLVRATQNAKKNACVFIDTARLGGATNAKNALKRAMSLKDPAGNPVEAIFFLTDGFELQNKSVANFPAQLQKLRARLAPDTVINTIGFWPADPDKQILKSIADKCGGRFVELE
jgi:hypothetical protein